MGERSNRNFFSSIGANDVGVGSYFFGPGLNAGSVSSGSSSVSPNGGGQISLFKFVLPFKITIKKVVVAVTVGVDGSFASFGIYSAAGALLVDSGPFNTAAAAAGTTISNTLAVPVTLSPGTYFFAQSCTNLTVTVVALSTGLTAGGGTLLNKNLNRVCRATNNYNGVVLPATTGALVNPGATGVPSFVLFENS